MSRLCYGVSSGQLAIGDQKVVWCEQKWAVMGNEQFEFWGVQLGMLVWAEWAVMGNEQFKWGEQSGMLVWVVGYVGDLVDYTVISWDWVGGTFLFPFPIPIPISIPNPSHSRLTIICFWYFHLQYSQVHLQDS